MTLAPQLLMMLMIPASLAEPIADEQDMVTVDINGTELLSVTATSCRVRGTADPAGGADAWVEVESRRERLSASDLSALTLSTPSYPYRQSTRRGIVIGIWSGLSWTGTFHSDRDVHLADAWRLYGLYAFCNIGGVADTWMTWLDKLSGRPRRDLLAFLREWVVWTTHQMISDEVVTGAPNELVIRGLQDCADRRSCEAFRDWLEVGAEAWKVAPQKSPIYRFY